MQSWEYQLVPVEKEAVGKGLFARSDWTLTDWGGKTYVGFEDIRNYLNWLGEQGWELVVAEWRHPDGLLLFKRPKE